MKKMGSVGSPCSTRFFRILFPGFLKKLMIPRALAKHLLIKEKCLTRATLVNPNGKPWCIEVYQEKQSMYFRGNGWFDFIHAHNLESGYFLVFSYKGNMVFNFKAFDLSSCEIAYTSVGNETKIKKRSHSKVFKEKDHNSRSRHFETTMTAHNLSNQNLYIPVEFKRKCKKLAQQHEISLKDPKGRSWPIRLIHRKTLDYGSNMHMGNGWLQFAQGNMLKRGDSCIFKLVNEGKETVMQVEILRKMISNHLEKCL